jgi:hypothetical protein
LLEAAEAEGFDALVTGDLSLEYQQYLTGLRIGIVSLSAHNWRIVKRHMEAIITAIDNAVPGALSRVDCGVSARGGREPKGPSSA